MLRSETRSKFNECKIYVICPQLYMQYYSSPMVDFVALKFGILIAKRLFNGNGISSNLAFMPVDDK